MTNYYVDSTATDDLGTGAIGDPWKYIATHVNSLSAGDIMYLRGGGSAASRQTYSETTTISPTVSGSSGNPITIANYPGEYVTIQSSAAIVFEFDHGSNYWTINGEDSNRHIWVDRQSTGNHTFDIHASNIILEYLEISGAAYDMAIRYHGATSCTIQYCKLHDGWESNTTGVNGIQIVNACNGINILNCMIGDFAGDGIQVGGDASTTADELNVVIDGCEFYIGVLLNSACGENGVDSKNAKDLIIRNCTFHGFRDCLGTCGGTGSNGEAVVFQNYSDGLYFHDNIIYDCSGGALITYRPNIFVWGNLVRDMVAEAAASEVMWHFRGTNTIQFWNNTTIGKFGASSGDLFKYFGSPTVVIKNNIFDDTGTISTASESVTADYNAWGSGATRHYVGANDVVAADLNFVNEGANDYTLAAASPCIDKGTVQTPYTDGYTGSAPDMGAFESTQPQVLTFDAIGTNVVIPEPSVTGGAGGGGSQDVKIEITRVAANTTTGTQDITISGFGTPKAAIFIVNESTTDDTAADEMNLSYGATDGTRQWAISFNNEHNVTPTDTQEITTNSACIFLADEGRSLVDAEAAFSTWITDGVRINWSDAPPSAWFVTVILFGGADLSAYANTINLGNTVDSTTSITTMSFEPSIVITALAGSLGLNASTTHIRPGLGLVHNDKASTITQRAFLARSSNGNTTISNDGRYTESYGTGETDGSAALVWGGNFSGFDSSGFDVTTAVAGANSSELFYLALDFGTLESYVGTMSTPTATGNNAQTGPGHKPLFVYQIATYLEAVDTAYTNSALAGSYALGGFSANNQYMSSVAMENGSNPADTQTVSSAKAVQMPQDDGTAGLTATFVSMDTNGFTLNYSAVETNAKKFLIFTVQDVPDNQTVTFTGKSSSIAFGSPQLDLTIYPFSTTGYRVFGTLNIQYDQSLTFTGVSSAAALGTLQADQDATFSGLSSNLALGSFSVEHSIDLTGLSSNLVIGSFSVEYGIDFTGLDSTIAFGTLRLDQEILQTSISSGIGIGTLDIRYLIEPTALSSSSVIGSLTIQADSIITMSALNSSIAFGLFQLDQEVTLNPLSSSVDFGLFQLDQDVTLSGLGSSIAIGSFELDFSSRIDLTSLASSVAIGDLTINPGNVDVSLSSLASSLSFGDLALTQDLVIQLNGLPSNFGAGNLTLEPSFDIILEGVQSGIQFGLPLFNVGAISILLQSRLSTVTFGTLTFNQFFNTYEIDNRLEIDRFIDNEASITRYLRN